MDKSRQQLYQSIVRYFYETEASVEPFLAEIVARYVILSCFYDISKSAELTQEDQSKLLEIAVAILQYTDENITAHSLRVAGASMSEFVQFKDLTQECVGRPAQLAYQCYKQICGTSSQDAVYAQLEQLLTSVCRPFALERNNTQLAYSLKISLNSILPRADVLVFRDMLAREAAVERPGQLVSSAQKQLLELADVTAGVSLLGSPPAEALQAVEQSLALLQKEVELQLNEQLGLFMSSVLPLHLHESDTGSAVDAVKCSRLRYLFLYSLNRSTVISALGLLYSELYAIYDYFKNVSGNFRSEVTAVQAVLQEKESVPKAQIYPRFQALSQMYQRLYIMSEQLVRARTWHARIYRYIDDRAFTPLPDTTATAALFTSEEVASARAWFVYEYGRAEGRAESGRFARLWLYTTAYPGVDSSATWPTPQGQYTDGGVQKSGMRPGYNSNAASGTPVLRDLSYFKPLDAEEITSCDCLFGGMDIVLLTGPQNSRPGVLAFANTLFAAWDLRFCSQKVVINNPKLSFFDNKSARELPPSGVISANMTTLMGPRGPELLSFSCPQTKELFAQNPMMFVAATFALVLSNPDFLPLVLLLDIPRLARFVSSYQLRDVREATQTRFYTQFIDPLPCVRAQIISDEPCYNGLEALVFKNSGGRRLQIDNCGYLRRPLYADLAGKYLIYRLAESSVKTEQEVNILSSGFSVDYMLSQDFLYALAEIGSADVCRKYALARRAVFKTTSESLLSQEERAVVEEYIKQNGGAEFVNMIDADAQTPLHFYETNIVPGYTSSEWELRARALRLFYIQKRRTKSGYTELTTYKSENAFQTTETHDAETQRSHDAYTREVVVYYYTKRPYPSISYASQILKDAGETVIRAYTQLHIDFDEIKKGADKYRQLREAARQ